jgi:hypothetical protein
MLRRMRVDARFCSAACRAQERRHRPRMNALYAKCSTFGGVDRHCQHCNGQLTPLSLDDKRADALYCSARCRQAAYRKRRAG